MNRKAILTILLITTTTLAGCLGGDDVESDDGSTTTVDMSDDNSTADPAPGETSGTATGDNSAPTATLTADVTEGAAPLTVIFRIDGEDADGDNLTWNIDTDGDETADLEGTEVPAEANFTFDTPGNYSVNLSVSDGIQKANSVLNITVLDGAPEPTVPETMTFTGTVTGAWAGTYVQVGGNPIAFNFTDNRAAVSKMTISVTGDSNAPDLDYTVTDPNGDEVVRHETPLAQEPDTVIEDRALLDLAGDWGIRVRSGLAVQGSYTVTVSFE